MDDDQQFCLRWNNHQSTLVAVFDTLLENGTLVDCTLAAEGKFLNAHKVVLSACSPYFEALLSRHYDKHPILILKDVKFQELKAMMDYMYRGEVNISQDQLGALLKAAESLQIKGLSDNKKDEGPAKRPAPSGAPKNDQPQTTLPKVQGLSIEQRNRDDRDGSTSPGPRKKKRMRRKSEDMDNHQDASNSSESHSLPSQNIPLAAQLPVKMSSTDVPDQIETKQEILRHKEESQQQVPIIKEKIETHSELMLEPKSEYVEEGNDDSIEDLTLDDDDLSNMDQMDEGAGPSHSGDGSGQQGFGHWQMGNQSQDEVFLAAQEAVGAHRDSQGYFFTPEPERNRRDFEDDDFLRERPISRHDNFGVSINKLTDGLLKLPKMPPPKLKRKPLSRSLESIADIEADQWDIASRASSRMPTPEPPRRPEAGLTADKILILLREISRRKEENALERQRLLREREKENLYENEKAVNNQVKPNATDEPEKKRISFNLVPGRKSRDLYLEKKLVPKHIENKVVQATNLSLPQMTCDIEPLKYNNLRTELTSPIQAIRPPETLQFPPNFNEPPPFYNTNPAPYETTENANAFIFCEPPPVLGPDNYQNLENQEPIFDNNQILDAAAINQPSGYETTAQTGYSTFQDADTGFIAPVLPNLDPGYLQTYESREQSDTYVDVNRVQQEPLKDHPNAYIINNNKSNPIVYNLEDIGSRRYPRDTNTDPVYKTMVSPYDPTKRNFQRDPVGSRRFYTQDKTDNVVVHNAKPFNRTNPVNTLENIGSRRQIPVARKEIQLTENNFATSKQEYYQNHPYPPPKVENRVSDRKTVAPVAETYHNSENVRSSSRSSDRNFVTPGTETNPPPKKLSHSSELTEEMPQPSASRPASRRSHDSPERTFLAPAQNIQVDASRPNSRRSSHSSDCNRAESRQDLIQTNISPVLRNSRSAEQHSVDNLKSNETITQNNEHNFEQECPPPPQCTFDDMPHKSEQQLFSRRGDIHNNGQRQPRNKAQQEDSFSQSARSKPSPADHGYFQNKESHRGYFSSTPKMGASVDLPIENELRNSEQQSIRTNNYDEHVENREYHKKDDGQNEYQENVNNFAEDDIEKIQYQDNVETECDLPAPPPPEISFAHNHDEILTMQPPEAPVLTEQQPAVPNCSITNTELPAEHDNAQAVTIFKKVYTCSGCSFKIANEKKFKIHLKFVHGQTPDVIPPENIKMVEQQTQSNAFNQKKKPEGKNANKGGNQNKPAFKRRSYQGNADGAPPQKMALSAESNLPNDSAKRSNDCERVKEAFRDTKRFKETQFSVKRRGDKTMDEFLKDDWQ